MADRGPGEGQPRIRALERGPRGGKAGAARAGAQVEHAPRRPAQPRPQAIAEKLGDVRARHDDATVDVERDSSEPSLVQQIGRWEPVADAFSNQRFDSLLTTRPYLLLQASFERQTQATQNQVGGLVARVARAVAVLQAR